MRTTETVNRQMEMDRAIEVELLTDKPGMVIRRELAARFQSTPGSMKQYVWGVLQAHDCTSRIEYMARHIQKLEGRQ